MLHHVSFAAKDPRHVAEVLARLIGGRVSPFGPWQGGFIAWANDGAGTAIEVYPHGTELSPNPSGQAMFRHSYFAQDLTSTHAAISVARTEDEIREIAGRNDWLVEKLDRGGFEVMEFWVENRVMLEVLTPAMLAQYLSVVGAPRISTAGDGVGHVELSVELPVSTAAAWKAWTDSDEIRDWWGVNEARIDLRIGGAYELMFLPRTSTSRESRGTEGCRVLSYVPQQMLSFTWNPPAHLDLGREHTWVVVTLTPTGSSSTTVALSHNGFGEGPQWQAAKDYFARAWRRALRRLQSHFEQVGAEETTIDLRTGTVGAGLAAAGAAAVAPVADPNSSGEPAQHHGIVPQQDSAVTIDLRDPVDFSLADLPAPRMHP